MSQKEPFDILKFLSPLPSWVQVIDVSDQCEEKEKRVKQIAKPVSRRKEKFHQKLEIARTVDIRKVVEQYVGLKRNGMHTLAGRCPFHDDKTPSFVVYTDQPHYYCFGCNEYGDVIKFIIKIEKVTFKIAVEVLSKFSEQN